MIVIWQVRWPQEAAMRYELILPVFVLLWGTQAPKFLPGVCPLGVR